MTSKLAILKWYPDMSSFFQKKLGVQNAPEDILVTELRDLANVYGEQELPPTAHTRITHMLDELSSAVEAESFPPSLNSLCDSTIFPVNCPGAASGLALRSLDRCYLSDKNGTYATAFKDKVPLLQLKSLPIDRISPLLNLDSFKIHVRNLETVVTHTSVIEGRRILDDEATRHYAERVGLFAR
jgi:hypothetical protein